MARTDNDRVECRTPTPGKKPTRIARWKYEAVRRAIRAVVPRTGDGVLFAELTPLVAAELTNAERSELGSLMWYVTTVKLEMEVSGELRRIAGASPQRLVRGR